MAQMPEQLISHSYKVENRSFWAAGSSPPSIDAGIQDSSVLCLCHIQHWLLRLPWLSALSHWMRKGKRRRQRAGGSAGHRRYFGSVHGTWSVAGSPLPSGKAGKCNLTMCPGRRSNSFHKQLSSLCQEVRRADEMGQRKGDPTAEFREGRIHIRKGRENGTQSKPGVFKATTGLRVIWGDLLGAPTMWIATRQVNLPEDNGSSEDRQRRMVAEDRRHQNHRRWTDTWWLRAHNISPCGFQLS